MGGTILMAQFLPYCVVVVSQCTTCFFRRRNGVNCFLQALKGQQLLKLSRRPLSAWGAATRFHCCCDERERPSCGSDCLKYFLDTPQNSGTASASHPKSRILEPPSAPGFFRIRACSLQVS